MKMKKSKDKNDDDIKWALKYARELMSMDWRVRSDCALDGEFYGWYGLTPEEFIKKYSKEYEDESVGD
jgi:hypothetical protein